MLKNNKLFLCLKQESFDPISDVKNFIFLKFNNKWWNVRIKSNKTQMSPLFQACPLLVFFFVLRVGGGHLARLQRLRIKTNDDSCRMNPDLIRFPHRAASACKILWSFSFSACIFCCTCILTLICAAVGTFSALVRNRSRHQKWVCCCSHIRLCGDRRDGNHFSARCLFHYCGLMAQQMVFGRNVGGRGCSVEWNYNKTLLNVRLRFQMRWWAFVVFLFFSMLWKWCNCQFECFNCCHCLTDKPALL